MMDESQTILLPNPVEVDGVVYASISLRLPVPEDHSAILRPACGRYMRGLRFVARLAGLPTQTMSAIMRSNDHVAEQVEALVLPHLN